mmetsp:Transcript_19654/g.42313  ORF Transcript_19654/g.42313 Transcript_19654/m.42313 type:complete len:454 (+) Transcript_19654:190-1551(+)
MEVNKEEAARCRDLGADALRQNQNARAVKFFTKSLQLYPLPGVKPLLEQAERKLQSECAGGGGGESTSSSYSNGNNNGNNNGATNSSNGSTAQRTSSFAASRSSSSASVATNTGGDGRAYTNAQLEIVSVVLKAKEGGRGAHYRVLGIEASADEAAIKKAYRKLALKLHPDKNSAPHSDEAFKAVGLAYATLSDSQKRAIYDRYGDEDPDNRGGGMGGGGMRHRGGNMHFHGQDVSPEDIFNMFFGGGMPQGGGGGVRFHSTGFGPGFAFGGMHPNMARAQQQQRQQQQQQGDSGSMGQLIQLLPLLLIMLLSFFNMPGDSATGTGGSRYFSLTPVKPFTNPVATKLSTVKDIPYYVSDQFLRTVHRDRYQLSQVERMVERSYERYLVDECKNQKAYKRKLEILSTKKKVSDQERLKLEKKANGFELTRCIELEDLFPSSVPEKNRVNRRTEF